MSNVSGIAFDLEGTIVDVEKAHHEAHLMAAKAVGLNLTIHEALDTLPYFIGGPDQKIYEAIWERSNKNYPLSFIMEQDKTHYHRLLEKISVVPRTGFINFLLTARKCGFQTAIGTLTPYAETMRLIKRSGLDQYFSRDQIVVAEDVKKLKPAPDIFLETARRMKITPRAQIVFEDSVNGVKAALTAGCFKVVGMPIYRETAEMLKNTGAWKIFLSWNEVEINKLAGC